MIANVLVALLAAASILGVARWWSKRLRAGPALVSLPRELREARLVYAEQLFAVTGGRLSISARVDRAYRLRSGAVVLLELKTRTIDRPYLSDVIELSAQRAAAMLQTGEPVADHAYVAVRLPGAAAATVHPVQLLDIDEVAALALRRRAIVSGRLAPTYAGSARICSQCAFAPRCEKRVGQGPFRRNATPSAVDDATASAELIERQSRALNSHVDAGAQDRQQAVRVKRLQASFPEAGNQCPSSA